MRTIFVLMLSALGAFAQAWSFNDPAWMAQQKVLTSGSSWPPAGDILSEDFESATTGTGWTDFIGTPTWGYHTSPAPLAGVNSLELVNAATYHAISTGSTFYFAFTFNAPTGISAAPEVVDLDSGGTQQCYFYITVAGAILAFNGTQSSTSSAGVVSAGTTYYVKGIYTKSTGGNGVTKIWVSTSNSSFPGYPTSTPTVSVTTGNSTTLPAFCELKTGTTDPIIYDTLRISANPQ